MHRSSLLSPIRLLALTALALAACAAPAVVPPTTAPTQPPTATALPPTVAATAQSTLASSNNAVPATSFINLNPSAVAFDDAGNLYVSTCTDDSIIYKVDALGQTTRYAGYVGGGFSGVAGDGGPAIAAGLACPVGLAFDAGGNLYVADTANNRIRRVDRNGIISTVAGSGPTGLLTGGDGGDGGPATAARLKSPSDIAVGADGSLYIDDAENHRIRKVDKQGIITTVAGNGTAGFSGDGGPATAAQIANPHGIDFFGAPAGIILDTQGNLYFSDSGNGRVRKVDLQGIITTIAGVSNGPAVAGDGGPATAAVLSSPGGLAFDAQGNLYIAESDSPSIFDSRIRKIDHNGIITTVAGTGKPNFSGDGGPAVSAELHLPTGLAFDRAGNLYIADFGNQRVRKVDTNGIITTVAGGHY